jgi:membrane-bound lytic murein transglycosylase B
MAAPALWKVLRVPVPCFLTLFSKLKRRNPLLDSKHPAANREQLRTAREAAEALFAPRRQVASSGTTSIRAEAPPAGTPAGSRKPRFLSAAPAAAVPARPAEAPPAATPRRAISDDQKERAIPKSAYGRLRTLVTYGMTIEEVADLYGVPARMVEGIVGPNEPSS